MSVTSVRINKAGSTTSAGQSNVSRHDVLSDGENFEIDEQHRAEQVRRAGRYAGRCSCLERGCEVCFKRIM